MQDREAMRRISRNLGRLLKEKGMSQRALARATEEPVMNISRLVRGLNEPGIGILTRVADALQTSVDALLAPVEKNSRRTA